MLKFSVIIPVYNVQDYVEKALMSVINQSYTNLEIICINDGSTDKSLEVLEKYKFKDDRIIIINQDNKGVSAARNAGIQNTTGDYVVFLDPDDRYDLNFCEKVAQEIEQTNSDIIVCDMLRVRVDGQETFNYPIMQPEHFNDINYMLAFHISACAKAFRKSFLLEHKILFDPDLKYSEDLVFCSRNFLCNPSYSYIPERLYFYTTNRQDSAMNVEDNSIIKNLIAYKNIIKSLEFKNQNKRMQLIITNCFLREAIWQIRKAANAHDRAICLAKIKTFLNFIRTEYTLIDCLKIPLFRKLSIKILKYSILDFQLK